MLLIVAAPLNLLALADEIGPIDNAQIQSQVKPLTLNAKMKATWDEADAAVLNGEIARPLVWGDQPLAMSVEFYRDSSSGVRRMAYFDKGRLDILDPRQERTSDWFVTPAALVREMLSGAIQFGEDEQESAGRVAPPIPVVGDLNQTNAITYATLGQLASIHAKPQEDAAPLLPEGMDEVGLPDNQFREVDKSVTALVNSRGIVTPDGMQVGGVTVGAYDDVTKHNIAKPFVDWAAEQPYPDLYLLGRPLTEPYWTEAVVGGVSQRVLFQAFERRVLTFTPGNPDGFKIESGNVGLHYRLWRSLAQPVDPALATMASSIPFGEEIISAAQTNLIDPHLLAAIVMAASKGDPTAKLSNGGKGVAGLRAEAVRTLGVPTKRAKKTRNTTTTTTTTTVMPTEEPNATATMTTTPESTDPIQAATASIQMSLANVIVADVLGDPELNIAYAAREVAKWNPESLNFASIAADYYSGGKPQDDDKKQAAFVDRVVTIRDELAQKYPMAVLPAAGTETGQVLGIGHAAYYSPSYERPWWERTLRLYESWNLIADGWQDDPNGYYCVRPGYVPGYKLQLVANGTTITCTIGDMVADPHLGSWLAHWVVEMNWDAFTALGLDRNNTVEVFHLGTTTPPDVPEVPPAPVEETPSAEETPIDPGETDEPIDETPVVEETPVPAEPTATPTEPVGGETPTPVPTEPTEPTAPVETPTPTPSPTPSPEPTEPEDNTVASPFADAGTLDPTGNYTLSYALDRSNVPGKSNASVALTIQSGGIDNYHVIGSEAGTTTEQWLVGGFEYSKQPDGTIADIGVGASGEPATWVTWVANLNAVPRAVPVGDGHYQVGARSFLAGIGGNMGQIDSASGTVDVWMSGNLITDISGSITVTNTDGSTGSLSISLSISAINNTGQVAAPIVQ